MCANSNLLLGYEPAELLREQVSLREHWQERAEKAEALLDEIYREAGWHSAKEGEAMSDPKRSYPYDAADLYAAFKAGLMVSGEGWNGEYPFNGERGKLDERFHQQWLEWFREFTR